MSKRTTDKPPMIFDTWKQFDKYMDRQKYHMNPIPVEVYVSDNFITESIKTGVTMEDCDSVSYGLHGCSIKCVRYRKYLDSPLYEVVNR